MDERYKSCSGPLPRGGRKGHGAGGGSRWGWQLFSASELPGFWGIVKPDGNKGVCTLFQHQSSLLQAGLRTLTYFIWPIQYRCHVWLHEKYDGRQKPYSKRFGNILFSLLVPRNLKRNKKANVWIKEIQVVFMNIFFARQMPLPKQTLKHMKWF